MLSVVIHDNGEPNVVKMTYQNLYKEIKDIPHAELLVADDWFKAFGRVTNNYVCFVEADCLVSKGFFDKQLKFFMKAPLRKISMLSPIVAVNYWDNCFYGYKIGGKFIDSVTPVTTKKSSAMYPIQVGYLPGSIIRTKMLREALRDLNDEPEGWTNDLVYLSTELSLAFWRQGQGGATEGQNGNPVYLNPSVKYVTTETYVNDIAQFSMEIIDLMSKFAKESI